MRKERVIDVLFLLLEIITFLCVIGFVGAMEQGRIGVLAGTVRCGVLIGLLCVEAWFGRSKC